jgi:hypothetical protein
VIGKCAMNALGLGYFIYHTTLKKEFTDLQIILPKFAPFPSVMTQHPPHGKTSPNLFQ